MNKDNRNGYGFLKAFIIFLGTGLMIFLIEEVLGTYIAEDGIKTVNNPFVAVVLILVYLFVSIKFAFFRKNRNLNLSNISNSNSTSSKITEVENMLDPNTSDNISNEEYFYNQNHTDISGTGYKSEQSNYSNGMTTNKDFIKAVMLNRYKKPSRIFTSNSDYPVSFSQLIQVPNIHNAYMDLVNQRYLTKPTIEETLLKLLKPQLVDIASELGISTSGNKPDIVTRILNTENHVVITDNYSNNYEYVLSNKGKDYINSNKDLIKLSRNYILDKNRYIEIRNELTKDSIPTSFETIAIILTQEMIKESLDKELFGRASWLFKTLGEFHFIQDNTDELLNSLLFSLILNLSRCGDYGRVESVSRVDSELTNLKKISGFNLDQVIGRYNVISKKIEIPYVAYNDSLVEKMITDFHQTGSIDFNKYARFQKRIPFETDFGDYWKHPFSVVY